jgi:WhiB family redox-sensing transcriptional regulator
MPQEHLVQFTSVLDQPTLGGSATTWPLPEQTIDLPISGDQPLPCQDARNQDLWFAEQGADVERAKALCVTCPIRKECLEGAIERREPWGVWGGEVFIDGQVVARKRGRGRPRKDDPYAPSARRDSSAA